MSNIFQGRIDHLRALAGTVGKTPEPPVSPLVEIAELSLASAFCQRLITIINRFDEDLDANREVGLRLVNFGQTFVIHLEDIGYWDPALLWFKGFSETGDPVELIQHVTQISIALIALPHDPAKPKRKIGFHTDAPEAGSAPA